MSIQQISRSTGSSRNLTQDFKKCRSDFRKAFPSSLENSTRELKFQSTAFHNNLEENKQDQLPPEWVDVYEKITEDLSRLEEKCKFYTVTKLKSVQAERMGIVFGDTSQKDREIEGLIQQTTKLLKETEGFVVNLCKQPGSKDDMSIRKNIQRKLAARLKQVTQKHRLMQKTHMENVQNKPGEEVANEGGLFDEKFEDFSQIAKVRDEGINVLVSNINELAIIFKELNMLVVDQGTILDRIDYNLTLARENTSKAVVFLGKAEKHQNCTRATSCLLFLIILIVVLLLLLIYKNF